MVDDTRRHRPRPAKARPSGSTYRTGYRKPPKEHRFRPGESGNASGRPKGRKNTETLLREILDRKIEVRNGSTTRKISVCEAILTRFAESALKGDTKSAPFLLQRYDGNEAVQEYADNATTPEEQEIIERYLEAYLKKSGAKK
jgi:Family of unknown function (DUF5681)